MLECVIGSNNEPIPQIHEVLDLEGYLRMYPTLRIDPNDLRKLPIDIISNDHIHLLPSR